MELLKFDDVTIRFFEVSHNIPECYGIAIKTEDGYIIYTSNYNFDQKLKNKLCSYVPCPSSIC